MSEPDLLIVGASARAAAISAYKAGRFPICIDQFADFDLRRKFPGQKVGASAYPGGIPGLAASLNKLPFIYTGAMENHLDVLEELQSYHTLHGNTADTCRMLRDPLGLRACWNDAGIFHPRVSKPAEIADDSPDRWLLKPVHGSGGQGIRPFSKGMTMPTDEFYLQQFIAGESQAAVFLGTGEQSRLVGVTQQLIGEKFLNAASYSYCGSIGPLEIDQQALQQWQLIGDALCERFSLKGLFCVDAICVEDDIYPVEVNPRYSASVEVLERAYDLSLLDLHFKACEDALSTTIFSSPGVNAKAYLFAGGRLRSPQDTSRIYNDEGESAETADIPMPGTIIEKCHPMMTVFASATNVQEAQQALRRKASLYYNQFSRL